MSIAPQIAELLSFPDGNEVDHVRLAHEATISRGKFLGGVGAGATKWALLLKDEQGKEQPFGEASFRILDPSQREKAHEASIDHVSVYDPLRNHLGMLVAVETVTVSYKYLQRVQVNRFVPAVEETAPSVAPHIEGWMYVEDPENPITPHFFIRD